MSRLVWIVVALLVVGVVAWLVARARSADRDRSPAADKRLDTATSVALEAPPAPVPERLVEPVAEPVPNLLPNLLPNRVAEPVAEPLVEPAVEPVVEPRVEPSVEALATQVAEPVARPALVPPAVPAAAAVPPEPVVALPAEEALPIELADPALWSAATTLDDAGDRLAAWTALVAPALRSPAQPNGDAILAVRFAGDTSVGIARADAASLEAVAERRKAAPAGDAAAGWLGRDAAATLAGTVLAAWTAKRYLADLEARLPEIKGTLQAIAPKLDPATQSRLKALVHELSRYLREARDNYATAIRKPVFLERVGESSVEAERVWQALQDRSAALRTLLEALANAPRYGEVQLERTVAHLHALHDERRIEALGARILAALTVLRLALGEPAVPRGARSLDALAAAHRAALEEEQALRQRLADCERSAKGPPYAGRGEFESNRVAARGWLAKLEAEPTDGAGRCLADARAALAAGFLDGEATDWTLLLRCDRDGRVVEARHARLPAPRGGVAAFAQRRGEPLTRPPPRQARLIHLCYRAGNFEGETVLTSLHERLRALPGAGLAGMRRGIEKESLRAQADGALALTPHPEALGSALTNPHITTDFSESQVETRDRRARRRRDLPRRADAAPPGRLPRDRRRAALGREHALPPARGRHDSDRPLRHVQRRPREERLPHGPLAPLRPAHADDLRHPLQLVDAGRHQRGLLRADPQLPAPFVPVAVSLRRVAGGVLDLRRRPRARAPGAEPAHAVHAPRHLAAHGAAGLPERRAGFARGELQQPRELRRLAAGRADAAVSGVRGDRHPQGDDYHQLATSLLQIENEFYGTIRPKRVIRPASARCTRCASAASSTSRCG